MTLAPELPGAGLLIERLLDRGITVSLGHSDATAEQANAAFDLGVGTVTHLFNAMRPFLHRDPGIVGAALARDDVVVQLILDGVHLASETAVVSRAAPGRVALVTDSITAAGGASDGAYSFGSLDVQVHEGTVRGPDGVLAGSVLTMIEAVRNLHALGVPLAEAVDAATAVPARVLGLRETGRLDVGLPADIVILDDSVEIERVLVAGDVHVAVYASDRYRAGWVVTSTPANGAVTPSSSGDGRSRRYVSRNARTYVFWAATVRAGSAVPIGTSLRRSGTCCSSCGTSSMKSLKPRCWTWLKVAVTSGPLLLGAELDRVYEDVVGLSAVGAMEHERPVEIDLLDAASERAVDVDAGDHARVELHDRGRRRAAGRVADHCDPAEVEPAGEQGPHRERGEPAEHEARVGDPRAVRAAVELRDLPRGHEAAAGELDGHLVGVVDRDDDITDGCARSSSSSVSSRDSTPQPAEKRTTGCRPPWASAPERAGVERELKTDVRNPSRSAYQRRDGRRVVRRPHRSAARGGVPEAHGGSSRARGFGANRSTREVSTRRIE